MKRKTSTMPMQEIEDLIEQSVRLIDTSVKAAEEKRNLIWNLFEVQKKFDCRFTHLRVFDILRKYDFVQVYAPEDYPGYKTHPQQVKESMKEDIGFILLNPEKAQSPGNPVVAYWIKQKEKIFVDFGSLHFTAGGGPAPVFIYNLARKMVQEAHRQFNRQLVYAWSAFILLYGGKYFAHNLSARELKEQYLNRIREIYRTHNFSDVEPLHDLLVLKNDNDWLENLKSRLSNEDVELIKWFTTNT